MDKTEKIRRIYAIILSVFIVAMGIALICVAADIYYSGEGPGKIYSREIVGHRLKMSAIPLLFLLAAIIAGAIFPAFETKAKRTSEETLKKLQRRMPASGLTEEFTAAQNAYRKMRLVKIAVWCSALAVAFACAIASLVFLLDTASAAESSLRGDMLKLVKVILPCTLAAVAGFIAASFTNGYCSKKQLAYLKTMIRLGSRETALPKELEFLDRAKKYASHDITLWAVRGIVLILSVTFIIVGALNGGAANVLGKAIQICSECIGLA